jgi:type I restriction enzyme, S subunit
MEVRPGYKQTEVGIFPEEWAIEPLGKHATFRTGPFGSALHKSDYTNDGVPVVNPMHIVDGKIQPTRTMTITDEAASTLSDFRLAPGEIVIGRRGDMGRCAVVQQSQLGWLCGTGSMIIRPRIVDSEFLQRILSSPGAISAIEDASVGTTMVNLNQSILAGLKIQFPPPPEQRAIATALSDVDALLGGLDRLIAKKRNLKQTAMQQLLTGETRLPGFHGEWEVKRLGELCDIGMGRTPPRLDQSMWGAGHPWLSIADLKSKVVSASKEQITERAAASMAIVPKGTLLMSFKLSIGRLCFAGCDLFTNEAICSLNRLSANPEFLYYALRRTDFSLYGKQAVKGHTLNKESLNLVEVRLPCGQEQTAIAAVLSDMDAELAALEARRDKTRALKQAMMQELLTGRTRLVTQDNYEGKP